MKALHGTWRLLSGRAIDANGRPSLVVSDGVLHYDGSGMVAAQCVISSESPDPEMRATLGAYVAYYGEYTVDEVARTVAHRIVQSNIPSYVGKLLPRGYELDGDRLVLFVQLADQIQVDPAVRGEMVWERVNPQ